MKRIRTGSFLAYLDNGHRAQVTYTSEFIKPGLYSNEIVSCIYQGVDITPVFQYNNGCTDVPYSIWKAMENNSEYLWSNPAVTN